MFSSLLKVQLLGGFHLIYNNAPIDTLNSARLQSLLAYLLLHPDTPHSRQYLAFLLWADSTEAQARNNFRQLLYQLRHTLPDADRFLKTDTQTVCWKTDAGQVIDIHRFQHALDAATLAEQQGDNKALQHNLEKAVASYHGDLLPGCYDEWIAPERDRLREQYSDACRRLMTLLETLREYPAAIQVAHNLHRLDPLDESVILALMRLFGLNGDIANARRLYQTTLDTLQRELGLEPSEELRAAYTRLQSVSRTASFSTEDKAANPTPLIGRLSEWTKLQSAWLRAVEGKAHLCLITGEAGIGKSRLAEELYQGVVRQGFTAAQTRLYEVEGSLSLAPITEWLRSGAIRPHLSALDPVWLTEIARLLPELLSEFADLARPEPVTEYGRRRRFFEALAHGILAAPRPTLLWVDDLQWCDLETLEWLHFLLRFERHNPLLLLGTARSEELSPSHPLAALLRQLQTEDKAAVIELAPLDAAETAKLAAQVHGHPLDEGAILRLYRETEGNPLFVVEAMRVGMTRTLPVPTEASIVPASPGTPSVPPRVQAIIMGRLSQLSENARKVAEAGAAIGRAFTLELLLLTGNDDEETTIPALNELYQRRIVREQNVNVFDFTHDKLREVTYAETSLPQRRLLHRRIAQALETLHADDLDPVSVQIAAHYEYAGLFAQAIPYYQKAGSIAAGIYANEDAVHLLNRALELLAQTPMSVKRDAQELTIQLALATLYRISKGWASREEERVMNHVMVLSDKVGDTEQRIHALFGMQTLYVVQAQFEKVERTYAQLEKLFREAHGTLPLFAEIYVAGAKLHTGQMAEARVWFDRISVVQDNRYLRDLQEAHGMNFVVHGLAWNSHALWCLGYPQTALRTAEAASEIAHEFAQPFNQALAVTYLSMLQAWRTDTATFYATAEDAYTLTQEYKAPYYQAWANIQWCYAQTMNGSDRDTIRRLREAIAIFMATGAKIRLPVYFAFLAQACLNAGCFEDGWEALEQALTVSLQNSEHWWDAEIYRLRGELMQAQGAEQDDIEGAFRRARDIAQSQEAKSLELRATLSLARFWQSQGRAAEAKALLTPIYGWFTEGFETPDLRAAQALIAQC